MSPVRAYFNRDEDERSNGMSSDDRREPRAKPRDEKFEKKERLIKTSEFRRVYNKGSAFTSESFVLKILPNDLSLSRIGFSISSRSIKKAFRRNRIRRLFREVFRKHKKEIKKGFDMALIVRKEPASTFSYKDAENLFLKLAGKAKILI